MRRQSRGANGFNWFFTQKRRVAWHRALALLGCWPSWCGNSHSPDWFVSLMVFNSSRCRRVRGTTWGSLDVFRVFLRSAGMTHRFSSRSNSPHDALRTSSTRWPVAMRNYSAIREEADRPLDDQIALTSDQSSTRVPTGFRLTARRVVATGLCSIPKSGICPRHLDMFLAWIPS